MTAWAWAHLLAAASGLVVAALALTRGGTSPLARPLALLAIDQFAINAGSAGEVMTGQPGWPWLGAVAAPVFVPFAFDFVLVFLGQRRRWKALLVASYVLFGGQSLLAAVDLASATVNVPGGLNTFALLLLVPSLPLVGFALVLLGKHLRHSGSVLERSRTMMLVLALLLVTLFFVTDPLADTGLPVPRLTTVGSFAFNALLTQLTLGLGLLQDAAARRRAALVQALLFGALTAVLALALIASFGVQQGVLVTAVTTLTLAVATLGWMFVRSSQRARAGLERFAMLGRFSAQMAHDLKNPLAGAVFHADVLREELRRAEDAEKLELADGVMRALARLEIVIDRYQGLSKMELKRAPLDLNELVSQVLARQARREGVTLTTNLAVPAPRLEADRDLLESALENLVKNAVEATPQAGTVTVHTRPTESGIELAVEDTGTGLDARALEQAFEPFFTTKARGSGLGLAFVRQVARAHGGDAGIVSREGVGTTVTLKLPVSPHQDSPHG